MYCKLVTDFDPLSFAPISIFPFAAGLRAFDRSLEFPPPSMRGEPSAVSTEDCIAIFRKTRWQVAIEHGYTIFTEIFVEFRLHGANKKEGSGMRGKPSQ